LTIWAVDHAVLVLVVDDVLVQIRFVDAVQVAVQESVYRKVLIGLALIPFAVRIEIGEGFRSAHGRNESDRIEIGLGNLGILRARAQ
jgi:hypothetical protein